MPGANPDPTPTPDPTPGGSTGGDTGGSTGGDTGGSTGGDTGGSTGGDTGGNTGGDTGGDGTVTEIWTTHQDTSYETNTWTETTNPTDTLGNYLITFEVVTEYTETDRVVTSYRTSNLGGYEDLWSHTYVVSKDSHQLSKRIVSRQGVGADPDREVLGPDTRADQVRWVPGKGLAYPVADPILRGRDAHGGGWFKAPRDASPSGHSGVDILGEKGVTIVYAPVSGWVKSATQGALGKTVRIYGKYDGKSIETVEGHLDQITVPNGWVNAGDPVGILGTTGNAYNTRPHVHFTVYWGNELTDPGELFPRLEYPSELIHSPSQPDVTVDDSGTEYFVIPRIKDE